MFKKIFIFTAGALGGLGALLAAALGFCAWWYSQDMRIDPGKGIDEAGYVKIGGIDQWIQIRGQDRNNPVLLWLTGGPGFTQIPATYLFRSWEKHFTVAQWDQRGEGKTFERSGTSVAKTMTIAQMTSDGIEVTQYLRERLHKNKIALLGFSWGSIVGVHMVHARPDLFSVYAGTGQVENLGKSAAANYPLLIERARALGNKAAEQRLIAAGPPPYPKDGFKKWIWVGWANQSDPTPRVPRFTPGAIWVAFDLFVLRGGRSPGADFSQQAMWSEMLRDDLPSLGPRFEMPVVFIQGAEDLVVGTALAKDYFAQIDAPCKKYVELKGIGHLAVIGRPELFLRPLEEDVRPLAVSGDGR